MARFMRPDTTWYRLYGPLEVLRAALYLLGGWLWIIALPLLLIGAQIAGRRHPSDVKISRALVWAGVSSLAGAAAIILIATFRPIMTLRYLAPFVPGILLLMIVVIKLIARGAAQFSVSALIGCSIAMMLIWFATGAVHGDSAVEELNYELASDAVMHAGVRNVVFTWDNPNTRAMHPEQIKEFGAFFFKRAKYQADVIPVQIGKGDDPNKLLLNAARPRHAAIIWVYDTFVKETAAKSFPPRISELDAGWTCQNAAKATFGVVTCLPVAPTPGLN